MKRSLKRAISLIVSACFFCCSVIVPISAKESDISKHWATATIQSWVSQGLFQGYSDGSFKPDNTVTKAEFLTLINRVFNFVDKSDKKINDVNSNAWYADCFSKAIAMEIVNADSKGNINPLKAITRQDAAVIIAKAFNLKAQNTDSIKKFTDYAQCPSENTDALAAMAEKGYIKGNTDKSFGYTKLVSRAEAITMINNAMGTLKKTSGIYKNSVTGNLVVNTKDVILKDMSISGDLYLTQGIENGEAILENVKVSGNTYVLGGGLNSIIIKNSSIKGSLVLKKKDGNVRVFAQGTTEISSTSLRSGAKLEEDKATAIGKGFGSLTIEQVISDKQKIILAGTFSNIAFKTKGINLQLLTGSINNVEIGKDSPDAKIVIEKDASVAALTADASLCVSGPGRIITANINSSGVVIEQKPDNVHIATDLTTQIGGTAVTGTPVVTIPVSSGNVNIPVPATPPTNPLPVPTSTITGVISYDVFPVDNIVTNIQLKKGNTNIGNIVHPNAEGAYTITNVDPGNYTIEASLYGYNTTVITIVVITGSNLTDKNITLNRSIPTAIGKIHVYPYKAIPNEIRNTKIEYLSGEKLVNGTVVFTLPDEFKATTNDKVNVGSSAALLLTEEQLSNNGKTVTITNITSVDTVKSEYISLDLFNVTIPAKGIYTFSVTADADGKGTSKSASSYTGVEADTLQSEFLTIVIDGNKPIIVHETFLTLNVTIPANIKTAGIAISTDGVTFITIPDIPVNLDSTSVTVTGLAKDKPYYFNLVVTDNNGITQAIPIPTTSII